MKLLLKILVGLVLLVLVLLALGVFFIDKMIRVSVEKSGSYALGVETTLEKADLGLLSGRLDLAGLAVANPEGFELEYFVEMGTAACEVSVGSLQSDVIDVPLLELADLTLDVERNSGGTNYGMILDNLARFESDDDQGGDPGTQSEDEGASDDESAGETRFTIGMISLKNISVTVNLLPEGGELTKQKLTIPELELRNVGTEEGGATATEITTTLITALLQATVDYGQGTISADLLEDLGGRLEGFDAMAEAALGDLEGRAEELGSQVEGALGGAGEKLEDKLDKGLGGLLGGKKDDDG